MKIIRFPGRGRILAARSWLVVLSAAAILITLHSGLAGSDENETLKEEELDAGADAYDPAKQEDRLPRLPHAIKIPQKTAEEFYQGIIYSLSHNYRRSGNTTVKNYLDWSRFNSAPFFSYAHGRRLLNTYVNESGKGFGRYDAAAPFPAGTVIATDSFAVEENGNIIPGPLFVMEKMPGGFNYVSGDWRFTLIQPDGTLAGQTAGDGPDAVDRCVKCHLAAEKTDYVFFPPKSYRQR